MRMIPEAIKSLTEHVLWTERDPNSTLEMQAEAHYYLALAYFVAGNFNNALQEIDTSLLMNASDNKFEDLRKEILKQKDVTKEKIERLTGEKKKMDEEPEGEEKTSPLDLDKSKPETGVEQEGKTNEGQPSPK
jgi:predicted Zn-dependent protease